MKGGIRPEFPPLVGLLASLVLALGIPMGAESQELPPPPDAEPDPRTGITFSILPDVTWTNWDDDIGIENTTLLGATASLGFGRFVDLQGYYRRQAGAALESLDIDDDVLQDELDVVSYGAQAVFSLMDGDVVPILLGGGGIYDFSPDNGNDFRRLKVNYGGGVRATLADWIHGELTVEGQSYRLPENALNQAVNGVDAPDGDGDTRTNLSVRAGLGFMLGGVGAPPAAQVTDEGFQEQRLTDLAFAIEPFGGLLDFSGETGLGSQDLIGARLGADIGPWLGLRGFYWHGVEFWDSFEDLRGWGGEAQFNLSDGQGFIPFLVVGGGRLDFQDEFEIPEGGTTPSDQNALILGGGLDFNLGERVQLAASVRDYITNGDNFTVDEGLDEAVTPDDLLHNWQYTASINFLVGGGGGFRPAVRPAAPAPAIDPAVEEMDWRQREIEQRDTMADPAVPADPQQDTLTPRQDTISPQNLREEAPIDPRAPRMQDEQADRPMDQEALDTLRQQLREDLREDLREELREDLREELREDLREELREDLRDELVQEVRDSIRDDLEGDLGERLHQNMRERMREDLRDDLRQEMQQNFRQDVQDQQEQQDFRQEEEWEAQDRQRMEAVDQAEIERMVEDAIERRNERQDEQPLPEDVVRTEELRELEERILSDIEQRMEARMDTSDEEMERLRDEIERVREDAAREREALERRLRDGLEQPTRDEQQLRDPEEPEERAGEREQDPGAIQPRPEQDRDPVIEDDQDIAEAAQDAPGQFELSRVRPYVGFSVNDNTQAIFGMNADLGPLTENSNWNVVPELALGVGEGPTSFMAVANLEYQVPWVFQQENFRFDPLLGAGAGLLNEDDLGAVLNLFYGGVLHLGGQPGEGLSLFLAHQGVDIFSDNRFLAGITFGGLTGGPGTGGTQ